MTEFDLDGFLEAQGLGSLLKGFGESSASSGLAIPQLESNPVPEVPRSWRVVPYLIQDLGVKERYDLEKGDVKFRLENTKDWSTLKWDATIPRYFFPGMNADNYYQGFLKTLFFELPGKIFGNKVTEEYAMRGFAKKSLIVVNEEKDELVYKLEDPAKCYDFAVNFIKPDPDFDFKSLTIKSASAHYLQDTYWLRLYYSEGWNRDILPNRRGEMHLSVPMSSGLAARFWNKNIMEWVLQTHYRNFSDNTTDFDSEMLADEIGALIKGFENHASLPQD